MSKSHLNVGTRHLKYIPLGYTIKLVPAVVLRDLQYSANHFDINQQLRSPLPRSTKGIWCYEDPLYHGLSKGYDVTRIPFNTVYQRDMMLRGSPLPRSTKGIWCYEDPLYHGLPKGYDVTKIPFTTVYQRDMMLRGSPLPWSTKGIWCYEDPIYHGLPKG